MEEVARKAQHKTNDNNAAMSSNNSNIKNSDSPPLLPLIMPGYFRFLTLLSFHIFTAKKLNIDVIILGEEAKVN